MRNVTLTLSAGIAIVFAAAGGWYSQFDSVSPSQQSTSLPSAPQSSSQKPAPQPSPSDLGIAVRGVCVGEQSECQKADPQSEFEAKRSEPATRKSQAKRDVSGVALLRRRPLRDQTDNSLEDIQDRGVFGDSFSRKPTGVELIEEEGDKVSLLGQALRTLPKGTILLVAPEVMTSEEEREVTAVVGKEISSIALRKYIGPSEQAKTGTLHVSSKMTAALSGPNFTVAPMSPEIQSVAEGFYTEWRWQVKATKAGEHALTATLYAVIGESQHSIDSYRTVVKVNVKPKTWADFLAGSSENAERIAEGGSKMAAFLTAIGTLFAGIAGWWYRQRRRRRSQPAG